MVAFVVENGKSYTVSVVMLAAAMEVVMLTTINDDDNGADE